MNPQLQSSIRAVWEQVHSPDSLHFPSTVATLLQLGVHRYRVDFVAKNITAYTYDNQVDIAPISNHIFDDNSDTAGSVTWNVDMIVQAIQDIQAGKGNYIDFSRRMIAAGTTDYTAYLAGKKVVYNGALGESHTELFPGSRKD